MQFAGQWLRPVSGPQSSNQWDLFTHTFHTLSRTLDAISCAFHAHAESRRKDILIQGKHFHVTLSLYPIETSLSRGLLSRCRSHAALADRRGVQMCLLDSKECFELFFVLFFYALRKPPLPCEGSGHTIHLFAGFTSYSLRFAE